MKVGVWRIVYICMRKWCRVKKKLEGGSVCMKIRKSFVLVGVGMMMLVGG